jgi:hypothetical protein
MGVLKMSHFGDGVEVARRQLAVVAHQGRGARGPGPGLAPAESIIKCRYSYERAQQQL